ncbi:hypothetical protein Tco_1502595 [Tanacetum coccineum]
MGTCAPYARRESFTLLTKTLKEILAMDNVNFPPPPPMVETPKKQNMNKFYDYHQDRGHNTNECIHLKNIEEACPQGDWLHPGEKTSGKWVWWWCWAARRERAHQRKREVPRYQLMNCPVVVEAMIEGFRVRRIHVDGGSSSEVMYDHCFRNLSYRTKSRLRESRIPLVGFSGEVSYPMGVIDLEVTIGECGKTQTVIILRDEGVAAGSPGDQG